MKIKKLGQVIPGAVSGREVEDSHGHQIVPAILFDGYEQYALIIDDYINKSFINRIKDTKLTNPLISSNFEKVEDNQQFLIYYNMFKAEKLIPNDHS